MKKFGLIGYPLSHSFSKSYFEEKFRRENIAWAKYRNFEIPDLKTVREIFSINGLHGLNVTVPHKEGIMDYLDTIDDTAQKIGAVNAITFENGKTKGYNTDIIGFSELLKGINVPTGTKALILGSGGSSKAVAYVLAQENIEYSIVSRQSKYGFTNYKDITEEIISHNKLIINCTPLGMAPDIHQKPDLPYKGLTVGHNLVDLIYNPEITSFMNEGIKIGCGVINGYKMLLVQAEESWMLWNSTL